MTANGIRSALNSHNVTLYSVVEAPFDRAMYGTIDDFVFGVEAPADGQQGSDQIAYVQNPVPNGNPTIPAGIFRDGPHLINGSTEDEGETDNAYVRMAWRTGGAAWNISVILDNYVSNPAIVEQFNEYFVDSVTSRITSKLAVNDVALEDEPILEVNLGGPAIGNFLAGDDPVLGASFITASSGVDLGEIAPSPAPTIPPNGNSIHPSVPLSVFQTAIGGVGLDYILNAQVVVDVPSSLVPDGDYVVELLFADLDSSGFAFFDLSIEDQVMLGDLEPNNIYYHPYSDRAFIGQPNQQNEVLTRNLQLYEPVAKRYFVSVSDGLQIEFQNLELLAPASILNGLRVLRVPSADVEPPQIVDVVLKGIQVDEINQPAWSREPYSFSELVPLGMQLAPIYTDGVNKISVHFSENVIVGENALTLYATGEKNAGETRVIDHLPGSFDHVPGTNVATWTFPVLAGDKYRIDVEASGVEDVAGNLLDGYWENMFAEPGAEVITRDDWRDDPTGRTLRSGNGMPGDPFQFMFALLPGDYNQDGIVDQADDVLWHYVDGDGDGQIGQQGDYDVWYYHRDDRLWLLWAIGGDYNDDEMVDVLDYVEWRLTYGQQPEYEGRGADGNANGVVDLADYVIWRAWEHTVGSWFIPSGGAGTLMPIVDFGNAPTVVNVTISGSESTHDPYEFDAVAGSGEQLRTVPVGGADTISITFSEDVNIVASNLRVVGLRTANVPTVVEFAYDLGTMTATWRFDDLVANDHYIISLSDAVTDVEGNRLDGEWVNPAALSTTNALVSEFPSGDGEAGGHFNFVVTLLDADGNRDNIVNSLDYSVWTGHYGQSGGFTIGDYDGDGVVTTSDIYLLYTNYGVNLQEAWALCDLNGDLAVDDLDLEILAENYGMSDPTPEDGDFNDDGVIDGEDVALAFAQFGLEWAAVS